MRKQGILTPGQIKELANLIIHNQKAWNFLTTGSKKNTRKVLRGTVLTGTRKNRRKSKKYDEGDAKW